MLCVCSAGRAALRVQSGVPFEETLDLLLCGWGWVPWLGFSFSSTELFLTFALPLRGIIFLLLRGSCTQQSQQQHSSL
jgi:hypothetical protein